MRGREAYLTEYLTRAPIALALVRAVECRLLAEVEMPRPRLDVGCGDGIFAEVLFGPAGVDFGIDYSPVEIARARRGGAYRHLQVGSANAIPFADGTFATALSNGVLEHVAEVEVALQEVHRVLRTGGRLALTMPALALNTHLLGATICRRLGLPLLAERYTTAFHRLFDHRNLWDAEAWREALAEAGFAVEMCRAYNPRPVIWVHELTLPPSAAAMLWKRWRGRWALWPEGRRHLLAPILRPLLAPLYRLDGDEGASLLVVARKLG